MRENLNVFWMFFFFIPIEIEVTNVSKDSNESVVTISCKIKFMDSGRFTASS